MPSTITVNVPGVAVVEPDTSYTAPVEVTAIAGTTSRTVSLPDIPNNGNVTRTLQITVSGVTGGTVTETGLVNPATNNAEYSAGLTHSVSVDPQDTTAGRVKFEFPATNPGDPDVEVTATVTSQWL